MSADLKLALARGTDYLLSLQHQDGCWPSECEANVMVDAMDIFVRELLGVRDERTLAATARWIRSQQRPDGSWIIYPGGPGDLSTTVQAYLALRLAGDEPGLPHMSKAAAFVRDSGGLESSRLQVRIWLALFGQGPWEDVPVVLPEVILQPSRSPVSLYRFSSWARLYLVPLGLLHHVRPVADPGFRLDELRRGIAAPQVIPRVMRTVDGAARWYNGHAPRLVRNHAVRRGVQWIIDHQDADGSWLACNVACVFCLLGLFAAGMGPSDPAIRSGLRGLDSFAIWRDQPGGPIRRMNCMPTPVWDTALSVSALAAAGVAADDPALLRAGRWLVDHEVRVRGDWSVARPGRAAGGWSVGFAEQSYPDCDDTAVVIQALSVVSPPDPGQAAEFRRAAVRGISWLLAMQSSDGGWAAYDADNGSWASTRLMAMDFTDITDRPCPDITGHALESLAEQGLHDDPRLQRAVRWLLRAQDDSGSWFGRWGVNHLYGTSAAVVALMRAGLPAGSRAVRRSVDWLTSCQNADGGWGEDVRSYEDPAWIGRGSSTPSQTSWALLALHAAGVPGDDQRADRGLAWLAQTQNDDGTWDEEAFTGTVLPQQFYMSYPMYRHTFPVMALGRYTR